MSTPSVPRKRRHPSFSKSTPSMPRKTPLLSFPVSTPSMPRMTPFLSFPVSTPSMPRTNPSFLSLCQPRLCQGRHPFFHTFLSPSQQEVVPSLCCVMMIKPWIIWIISETTPDILDIHINQNELFLSSKDTTVIPR